MSIGLDHGHWDTYQAALDDGWTYLRPTVLWGKAYWWLQHGTRLRLIGSPLASVDADTLTGLAEQIEAAR
jgi:hypothetical protein